MGSLHHCGAWAQAIEDRRLTCPRLESRPVLRIHAVGARTNHLGISRRRLVTGVLLASAQRGCRPPAPGASAPPAVSQIQVLSRPVVPAAHDRTAVDERHHRQCHDEPNERDLQERAHGANNSSSLRRPIPRALCFSCRTARRTLPHPERSERHHAAAALGRRTSRAAVSGTTRMRRLETRHGAAAAPIMRGWLHLPARSFPAGASWPHPPASPSKTRASASICRCYALVSFTVIDVRPDENTRNGCSRLHRHDDVAEASRAR